VFGCQLAASDGGIDARGEWGGVGDAIGWSWLVAVVRSNRPAALEVGDNMLTLTSAQTEFNLSIRMNL
jgi:hypothetical protein